LVAVWYTIGFVAFIFLALLPLAMLWILKYVPEGAPAQAPERSSLRLHGIDRHGLDIRTCRFAPCAA